MADLSLPLATSVSVVIVDDSPEAREMFECALTYAGFHVIQADSAPDALSLAQEVVPDVIVTDLAMRGIDGFELLARIQADPRTRGIPVIVVSAWGNRGTPQRSIEAGASAFLWKPCLPTSLIAKILSVVDAR